MTILMQDPASHAGSSPLRDDTPKVLKGESRTTLNLIFKNPLTHHLAWNEVRDLFEALGSVKKVSNHRFELSLDGHHLVFLKPHTAHLTESEMLELRGLLQTAGWTPSSVASTAAMALEATANRLIAVVVVTNHDATVYHLPKSDSDAVAQTAQASTFRVTDSGREGFLKAIAKATAEDPRVFVFGVLGKGLETLDEVARYLRKHHKRVENRAVHELATEALNLESQGLQAFVDGLIDSEG